LIAIYLLNELMNSDGDAIYGVLSTVACDENLRPARANRAFGTDKRRIRTKSTVMDKSNSGLAVAFIQDRRLRADGFSSAQHRNSATMEGAIYAATYSAMKCAHTPRSMLHILR
jgi:hypothetical protein